MGMGPIVCVVMGVVVHASSRLIHEADLKTKMASGFLL